MRNILLAIVLLSNISVFANGDENLIADKNAIMNVIEKETKAQYQGNYKDQDEVWHHKPYAIRMLSSGERFTSWDSIYSSYKYEFKERQNVPPMENLEIKISDEEITVLDNYAFVIHNQHTEFDMGGWKNWSKNDWVVTSLEKVDGSWKIIFHMNGKLPKKEPSFSDVEQDLNVLGYKLMGLEKLDKAIQIFKLNVEYFPDSWNVYDSLGEALMKAGDNEAALRNYEKSLQLNPDNKDAENMIKKLNK